MMLLGKKGMNLQAPIFVRIFKEESELEVWKQRDDGHYYLYKAYPICTWSGELGPKLRSGDRQAPEGFYTVSRDQMRPDSKHYLAFNLGFPNAYDKANRRTGHALMVHGKCSSAGCYAMTDALMEEIYGLAREAIIGGQDSFHVHAFPFRMTQANMARHAKSEWYPFWKTLKEGYDYFELTRQVPTIAVCNRRYVVNVSMPGVQLASLNPAGCVPGVLPAHPQSVHAPARRADRGRAGRGAGAEDAHVVDGTGGRQRALGPHQGARQRRLVVGACAVEAQPPVRPVMQARAHAYALPSCAVHVGLHRVRPSDALGKLGKHMAADARQRGTAMRSSEDGHDGGWAWRPRPWVSRALPCSSPAFGRCR